MEAVKMNHDVDPKDHIPFKAETRQLLNILIHSLYKQREIFLRELISNASDALTRMNYVLLTNRDVINPEEELKIHIEFDPENNILTISDTGIGMTEAEIKENLGTIAHSGVRAFINAVESGGENLSDIIGQFGVGFYSAFMVAEWIRVNSRSYKPDTNAISWYSTGVDTFTVEPAEKEKRGTSVIIKLKEDAGEFIKEYRLKEVIRKHSDFIPFPIFLGDDQEQVNRQTAIWRQQAQDLKDVDYNEFYKHLTLEIDPPLLHIHMVVDAPVQMYALLYLPEKQERSIFSPRKEDGLKLYSHKILIDEYNRELIPHYFRFIQGVVDSEDLPLNISRETIQSNRLISQIKKLITKKIIDSLEKLAKDDNDKYHYFWESWGVYLKEGIATEPGEIEALVPLLRFHTTSHPDIWSSLEDYISRMKEDQREIYFLLGEDKRTALRSPHLEQFTKSGYEILLCTDPIDAFMLVRLTEYKKQPLTNASKADINLPKTVEETPEAEVEESTKDWTTLIERFKTNLGDRVSAVRMTERLSDSPARLVDKEGTLSQELQRVYSYLNEKYETPQKILELNPKHPVVVRLSELSPEHKLNQIIIEQVYENALMLEGLHPDPSSMITRIQKLMEIALKDG